ncbi:Heteroproteinous nuclear ribonucleoprotein L [Clonorchis sinensis]|uniref:Heteroproteinous nuclear ribonucleoprotein L n=2 Tax=Clonorchis sinensis TaxID=79923 RepID=A0A8T1MZ80_CLOSI|nr:Heteroproteinous nuclear ribonucleoprotein L [Clonorchis sinensis]GAA57625.1 heterogeneous nuclear ribonucleoprotein L [Clonorchis sinensis]
MTSPAKRSRYDTVGVATAQFYNTTGIVPTNLHLPPDVSYLITTHPSCTIVVYELPTGCSEQDLISIFRQFGEVKNAKVVCNGKAALVEFCEISSPTRLVHMAKINPFHVGPNRVRLEFSSETIPFSSSRQPEPKGTLLPSGEEATCILHLDVAAADYPITVDVIRSICEPHGKLVRVFIGKKNVDRSLEVLVEFESPKDAAKAKEHLDGADIYSGCCSLTATFSKVQKVHVTKNDSESWDFSGPNACVQGPLGNTAASRTLLGSGAPLCPTVSQSPPPPTIASAAPSQPGLIPTPSPMQAVPPCPPPPPPPPFAYYAYPAYRVPPMYPPAAGMVYPYPQYPAYYPPPATPSEMPVVRSTIQSASFKPLTRIRILPSPAPVHQVTPGGIGVGHATSNLSTAALQPLQTESVFECIEGVVLMVCNLPLTFNCDHLFNLLCVYGNVARVKFLKSRPGCAMVQVGNAEAADFIHRYYNGISVFGHTIRFYHSKQPQLVEHDNLGTLDDGSPVMKNYMMDPNNRFRNAVVASKSRILEPSRTLHFFNAPLNISPEDMCRVFTDSGAVCPPRVVLFNTKAGQKTSLGLAEWDTLSEALEALILANQRPIHVAELVHPFHLKLAFSPKPISSDGFGVSLIRYPAPPFSATRPGCEYTDVGLSDTCPPEEDEEEGVEPVTAKELASETGDHVCASEEENLNGTKHDNSDPNESREVHPSNSKELLVTDGDNTPNDNPSKQADSLNGS